MAKQKKYGSLPFDRREILRYAGVRGKLPAVEELLDSCLVELNDRVNLQVCWDEFPVRISGDEIDFSFAKTSSADLKKMLKESSGVVIFGATVGLELDRLIARYSRVSPARAVMFQAIGTERIESLCDCFQNEIGMEKKTEGFEVTPRFSPGYGDLSLSFQREVFRTLECPRRIGLVLNESLMMSPTKSVTAIFGIRKQIETREEN